MTENVCKQPRKRPSCLTVIVVSCFGVWLLMVFAPPFEQGRSEARTGQCRVNLKQISLALRQYYADHGVLPPSVVRDDAGRPMHSWRVLLLPYLGETEFYDQYRFDEPWNSPHNRSLKARDFNTYSCPSDSASDKPTTYLAIVGPGTAWEAAMSPSAAAALSSDRLLVAEVLDSGVDWREPKDINVGVLGSGIWPPFGKSAEHHHREFVWFMSSPYMHGLQANGEILQIPTETTIHDVRRQLTLD